MQVNSENCYSEMRQAEMRQGSHTVVQGLPALVLKSQTVVGLNHFLHMLR